MYQEILDSSQNVREGQRGCSSILPGPHADRVPWSKAQAYQVALGVKNPPANAGDIRDAVSIPGSGRSPAGGRSNPLQYSGLVNPMDRAAWWAKVLEVSKGRTWLKQLSTHVQGPGTEACFVEQIIEYHSQDFCHCSLWKPDGPPPLSTPS